jgi:hypothetical protein
MYFSMGVFLDSNCLRPGKSERRVRGREEARGPTSLGLQRVALDVRGRQAMGLKLLSHFMRERGIWMSPIHCFLILENC